MGCCRPAHELDGRTLTPRVVAAIARGGDPVRLSPEARGRNDRARAAAAELARRGTPVYGRTTGGGSRKEEAVPAADVDQHARRLLRSHAGGAGGLLAADTARAMLVVRLNQLGAGGAGVSTGLLDATEAALNAGLAPLVHEIGSIGTGDLTALAEAGLSLQGENAWYDGGEPPVPVVFGRGDALAWMSTAARTLGEAALAVTDVEELVTAGETVSALSLLGARGTDQALDERVQAAHAHPGQVAAAAHLRLVLAGTDPPKARLQDSFAFRCLPQVHGVLRDALAWCHQVLCVELNTAAENPLLADGPVALHNGNFLMTHLTLAVDQVRAALLQVGMSAVRQLAALLDPEVTGLPAFLAGPEPASSGLMVLEYTAQSALAQLRAAAQPVSLATAHASHGVEDHASFADAAVRQLSRSREPLALILGCVLVAATRALRMRGGVDGASLARDAYALACDALPADPADRPLSGDVHTAADLLSGEHFGALERP